jgi:hypothetical protein
MNTRLLERLDARLKEFISTEELPYGSGLMGPSEKPNFPALYLSRSTDPGLMKLPGEGSAMVRYKVKRREIDESRDDGQPLYGASIEIREIEPVAEEAEETGLESTVFLKEFAGGYVNTDEGIKKEKGIGSHLTRNAGKYVGGVLAPGSLGLSFAGGYLIDKKRRKGNIERTKIEAKQPLKAKGDPVNRKEKTGLESTVFLKEFARTPVGKVYPSAKSFFGDPIVKGQVLVRHGRMSKSAATAKRAGTHSILAKAERKKSADALKHARKLGLRGHEFGEARDRDGEGRFAAGNVPGPQDYAIADAVARKRGKRAMAPVGGVNIARNARGRVAM